MIPDEIKNKIEMFGRSRNAPYRNHQQEAIACAEFGYSLANETINSMGKQEAAAAWKIANALQNSINKLRLLLADKDKEIEELKNSVMNNNEEILKTAIDKYNSTANDMHKFKLNKQELELFYGVMETSYRKVSEFERNRLWVSIESGSLPEPDTIVLAFYPKNNMASIAVFRNNTFHEKAGFMFGAPTHWMPLPEPPKS